jgi:hypothetical protein
VRTSPGLYLPSWVDNEQPDQRVVAAAGILRPGEAVTGWAALAWERARWFDGTAPGTAPLPVPLVVRRHLTADPSYSLSQEYLAPGELVVVDGLPVTPSVRSVCFEARYAGTLVAAVVAVDMAAYSDLVSLSELAAHVHSRMAPTGIGQARRALALAVENSWSPQETVMRLTWKAWSPTSRLLCNVPVFDRTGRHLATPDLLDAEAGVVGEYEGGVHLAAGQRASDVRREAVLRAAGLECVTMVAADHADAHVSFLTRLGDAYVRARATSLERGWTLERPRWWVDTSTVVARRSLDPLLRERLLRHRRAA